MNLLKNRKKPFTRLNLKANPSSFNSETLNSINKILNKHNVETDNFHKMVKTAREQLETAFVAESLEDYIQKEKQVENFNPEVNRLNTDVSSLSQQISTLEREITEHRLPADELNKDLTAYLGRNEIQLTVKDTGYQITQNGEVAGALSEGEKTAIAFLYFLKSLNDKNFNLVVQGANSTSNNCELENRYHYPNIVRRVLEAFLAFRKPKEAGELKQQMDALRFNVEKKTKILRFAHTHSHYGHIGDPEHDISILSETPAVLHDLIELIKSEDPKHFNEMISLLNNINEAEETK